MSRIDHAPLATRLLAFCSLLLALPADSHADNIIEVGTFAGAHVFSSEIELGNFDEPGFETPQNGLAFGIRANYTLMHRFGAEFELSVIPTKSRVTATDVTVFGWRAHGYAHLWEKRRVTPFVLLGVGAMTASSSDAAIISADTDLVMHGGAGAAYQLTDTLLVRADGRLLFPPSANTDFVTTDFELTIGISRTFSD